MLAIATAALACGGSTGQEVLTPSGEGRCRLSLSAPQLPAAGATIAGQLGAPRECGWTATTSAAWLRIEPTSGQGNGTLMLTAPENPEGRIRSAPVTINDQSFAVTQEASPCRFEVTPPALSMPHQGGRAVVQVKTLAGCSWTTTSSQPWLRVISGSGGEGSGPVEIVADSNTGAERSALLGVAGLLVAVSQSAGPNDRTECRFSLEPGGITLPAAGGNGSFAVSTLPGCAWSPLPSQSWVTILSSINVVGSADVVYRVEPNPTTAVRSAAITAGTRRHVITQAGQPRP